MQITDHVYSTHIQEDPSTFGAMHPGGTQIYFVGDPSESMVVIDSGEPYRFWTRQIMDYWAELGRPPIDSILITHGHGDHIGGLDRPAGGIRLPGALPPQAGAAPPAHPGRRLGPGASRQRDRDFRRWRHFAPTVHPRPRDDHVCYFLRPDRVLFSGDNLLGNSSSSVRNLKQYMNSLGRMARTRPLVVCPGHGNTIIRGQQRIQQQITHRLSREDQGSRRAGCRGLHGGRDRHRRVPAQPAPVPACRGGTERAHPPGKLRQENRVIEREATYVLPD